MNTECIIMKNRVAQGSLALPLLETWSNPLSEQRQALGKVLEIIHRTDLHQDLVMCDLFISLSGRLTMLRMFENLRNLSKLSENEHRRRSGEQLGTPSC